MQLSVLTESRLSRTLWREITGDADAPSVPGSITGSVVAMGSKTMFGDQQFLEPTIIMFPVSAAFENTNCFVELPVAGPLRSQENN